MRVRRPSRKRHYTVTVSALLDTPKDPGPHDAMVVLFLVDPESAFAPTAEVLEDLYDLTHSEAQIVRLIAEGFTLEDAARAGGVSVNTARSHLKHVFAKMGTTRQSELLRRIVTGVGSMGADP